LLLILTTGMFSPNVLVFDNLMFRNTCFVRVIKCVYSSPVCLCLRDVGVRDISVAYVGVPCVVIIGTV